MNKYGKRDERRAETARSFLANKDMPTPAPVIFACSVCGILQSGTVPIFGVSIWNRPLVAYCGDHLPAEWQGSRDSPVVREWLAP